MRYFLTFFIGLYALTNHSYATHVAGATIDYKYVTDSVYDFYITYYRSCNGVAFTNPSSNTRIGCAGGGCASASMSLTLVSINHITDLCKKASNPCNPTNTGFTGKGLEEHIYKTRIDFRTSPYNYLYSKGDLIVETGQCCRQTAITTGAANQNFYIYTLFNPSKTPKNSSPVFAEVPRYMLCCNQAAYLNFEAKDADGDSLSYASATPLINYSTTANYSGTLSANKPLDVYDPTGKGTVNPNVYPPTGYYLGATDGQILFMPVKCDAVTPILIVVSEWRRNSSGTYVKIGTIMREIVVEVTTCSDNYNPSVVGATSYNVCEGDSISFLIKSDDKTYTPPPPLPKPDPDTVSLSWNGAINGATFKVVSDTAMHQSAIFRWSPGKGTSSALPYTFIVKATDNHCPRPGFSYKSFKIYVKIEPVVSTTIQSKVCGSYSLTANVDTTTSTALKWEVFDSKWAKVTDSLSVAFGSNNAVFTNLKNDQLKVYKSGKYYLRLVATMGNCSKTLVDSITTAGYINPVALVDTAVCSGTSLTIAVDSDKTNNFTMYKWMFNGTSGSGSSINVNPKKGAPHLLLEATGTDGCIRFDTILIKTKYKPLLIPLPDTAICALYKHAFATADVMDSGFVNNVYKWSTGETTISVNRLFNSGMHWVQIQNECGSSSDSFFIQSDSLFQPDLIPDKVVCDQLIFKLIDQNYKSNVKYKWNTGDTTASIFVKTNGTYKVTALNACENKSDSVEIEFLNTPKVDLGKDLELKKPFSQVLDGGTSAGKYKWNTGDTSRTITVSDFGTYWVEISNACGKVRDSISLTMNVGMNDNRLRSLTLFPNPTNGTFNIPFVISEVVDIRIVDELGQNIAFNKKLIGHQFQIEIPNAISGVYLVELHGHGFVQRGRLVVLR